MGSFKGLKLDTDATVMPDDPWGFESPIKPLPPAKDVKKPRPAGHPFKAELECAELDERSRPGPIWPAKARELSRSHIVLASKKMMYEGRRMLILVHLIDDRPTPLLGRVVTCEYESDGLCKIDLDLLSLEGHETIRQWVEHRTRGGRV
ncbi:MAG: hypothetical protein SFY95_02460 [Planctomycetota bacterium]|nr:hypothetical protein [Planctomycetota bacterium]